MPQDAQIVITSSTIPEGVCFSSEQDRFNTFAAYLQAVLPGTYSTFVKSASTPSVDDQDKPWIKINADGSLVGVYTFSSGAWVRPYPIPAGPNGFRMLWADTLVALETYDGGSAGAVTATSGPFYEVDSDFTDRIPRGAGTVAVNTNANELASGSSATDSVRGIYIVKRTARTMIVG
jgi:hypothetical protein